LSRIDAEAPADCSIVLVRLQRNYDREFRPCACHHERRNIVTLYSLHITFSTYYVGGKAFKNPTPVEKSF